MTLSITNVSLFYFMFSWTDRLNMDMEKETAFPAMARIYKENSKSWF